MFDWFYGWLDPKILRLEEWVNAKVVNEDAIDIDLDKVKRGEVRPNHMFKQAPHDGNYGPFVTNLENAVLVEYMQGVNNLEGFALLDNSGSLWWRHRADGVTQDFQHEAFKTMQDLFEYAHGDRTKYWDCVLRTKALKNEKN